MPATGVDPRRSLPSVDQALQRPEVQALVAGYGRVAVLRALRDTLATLRERAAAFALPADAVSEVARLLQERLEESTRPSLRRVINATGVVVHTNLGRAPLSTAAAARVAEIASGYSNLEYDL
ncbi:MAG TPA: L-seryl-tRNA(Sec) selenium transferase, partial [Vicinamibacteria bacterium]|nr:L-seryl-tRNA(Sec) selenium transferase [Vicinamibacteria bacterium]